jgi:hypothetical protein
MNVEVDVFSAVVGLLANRPRLRTHPASEEFLSKFLSSRYLSSSGSYPLDLSGVGDPAGSNATAGLALRVTGTHKPLHHDKVEVPSGGFYSSSHLISPVYAIPFTHIIVINILILHHILMTTM